MIILMVSDFDVTGLGFAGLSTSITFAR